jgi:uncharacterized protein
LLGTLAGLTLGLTGVGGGILAIPSPTFGAGLPQTQAASIALVAVSPAIAVAAVPGLREGTARFARRC